MSIHSEKWHWHRRECDSIAQGALTNSKRAECFVKGVYPTHIKQSRGCYAYDSNRSKYIDFICGLGSSILGFSNEEVNGAVKKAIDMGSCFSLSSELEVLAAEKLKEVIPFVERVKFLKTGSDACSAAIKIARAFTGRGLILTEGYHGWHDGFVSISNPALGVFPRIQGFSSLNSLEDINPGIAAVIVEPIQTVFNRERIDYLNKLRERCTQNGVLLIFDEVITGFRVPKFTISNLINVTPDLICVGKAMGNGFSVSAVAGKKNIMECGEYFVSSTFAGETTGLAAAIKTIELLQTKYKLQELWDRGEAFLKAFNSIAPENIFLEAYPSRGAFRGNEDFRALFWQEAVKAGILFGPSWFFNFSHFGIVDQVISVCGDIVQRIKTGSVNLEGEMPRSPFAAKLREKQS